MSKHHYFSVITVRARSVFKKLTWTSTFLDCSLTDNVNFLSRLIINCITMYNVLINYKLYNLTDITHWSRTFLPTSAPYSCQTDEIFLWMDIYVFSLQFVYYTDWDERFYLRMFYCQYRRASTDRKPYLYGNFYMTNFHLTTFSV